MRSIASLLAPWFLLCGQASAQLAQPKTHLGGKAKAIVELVHDCSRLPQPSCTPTCLICACTPKPQCCSSYADNGCPPASCTADSDCPTPCTGNLDVACGRLCSGGDRDRQPCQSEADCPHLFMQLHDTCPAIPAGAAPGTDFRVPAASVLVVTDVISYCPVRLFSDDGSANLTVFGAPAHFTAGLTFGAGSKVNIESPGTCRVQLLGYFAR